MVSSVNLPFLLADAGVPMIFITWPGMVLLLVPIIGAEWAFIVRRTSLQKSRALWATVAANAASTIIGIPITWGVLFLCEIGFFSALDQIPKLANRSWNSPLEQIVGTVLSAPWIAPVEGSGSWAVPLAALVLLIPFYFVSVLVEQKIMEHMVPVTTSTEAQSGEVSQRVLRRAVRGANLMSYGFLFAFATAWLLWGVSHR
ncbi:MAG TPA: hypothetical protein VGS27_06175 [Candidatus Sulfotelmatobacter sp.]|nr:hypothetical protein [Candidatus Sulfotelmatobacter sp.]